MRQLWVFLAGLLGVLLTLAHGCRGPDGTPVNDDADLPVWFRDTTGEAGLDFVHEAGPLAGDYPMPQIVGSGAAMFDFDNDGLFDLYFIQNGGPGSSARNRLYRQRQDGTFKDVSAGSGLDIAAYGMGAAVGDFDNDGWGPVRVCLRRRKTFPQLRQRHLRGCHEIGRRRAARLGRVLLFR